MFQVGIDISKLDGILDDLDFTEKLISEQSVFCLPGKVNDVFFTFTYKICKVWFKGLIKTHVRLH